MAQEAWNSMFLPEAALIWTKERGELKNASMILFILDHQLSEIKNKAEQQVNYHRKQLESIENIMQTSYKAPNQASTPIDSFLNLNASSNFLVQKSPKLEAEQDTSYMSPSIVLSTDDEGIPAVEMKSPKIKKNKRYLRHGKMKENPKADVRTFTPPSKPLARFPVLATSIPDVKEIKSKPKAQAITSQNSKTKTPSKNMQYSTLTQMFKMNSSIASQKRRKRLTNKTNPDENESRNSKSLREVDKLLKMVLDEVQNENKDSSESKAPATLSLSQMSTQVDRIPEKLSICIDCESLGMLCTKHMGKIEYRPAEDTFDGFWDMDFTTNHHFDNQVSNSLQSVHSTMFQ